MTRDDDDDDDDDEDDYEASNSEHTSAPAPTIAGADGAFAALTAHGACVTWGSDHAGGWGSAYKWLDLSSGVSEWQVILGFRYRIKWCTVSEFIKPFQTSLNPIKQHLSPFVKPYNKH